MSFFDADFWVGVGVTAGIYAIFALGLQLNVGFTGLINFGQAGFMAIGAYAMGMFAIDADWPLWLALPAAILIAIAAGILVGMPTLRLRADYFGIVTIAFSEIVRYTLQNADFAGGNQGILGYDTGWRTFEARASNELALAGLGAETQLPLLIAVWGVLFACLGALKVFERSRGRTPRASPFSRLKRSPSGSADCVRSTGRASRSPRARSLRSSAPTARGKRRCST
jgi:branched-chain amino acid transport system permease protein